MEKERKQDLSSPDEEALEKRVHDMLDITASESAKSATAPEATPKTRKATKVTVTSDESPEENPAASELATAIEATNEELAQQTSTAPLVARPGKKVAVTHFEDKPSTEPPTDLIADDSSAEAVLGPPELTPETAAELEAFKPVEPTPQLIRAEFSKPTLRTEPIPEDTPEAADVTVGDLLDKDSVSPLTSEIESTETDKAVSDIIAREGDELLEIQAPRPDVQSAKKAKSSPGLFKLLITSSGFRWVLFLALIVGLVFVGAYPKTRYLLLNKAGVTSAASVTIMDQSTLRPLKNAKATIAGITATSDENGKVSFKQLPLGPTELVIEKRAFTKHTQAITIGWGSNPFADVSLKPQGDQYTFQIKDVLSGKAIGSVEASVGELVATADANGQIKLTLDDIEGDTVDVTFKAAGYKDQVVKLELSSKAAVDVLLSPDRQAAFISKRTGKYDLYRVDVDGKNESLVLKGTGNESADITLLQHPTDDIVMLISTRDASYTTKGDLMNNLTFVNIKDGSTKSVSTSTQVRAIDWIGTRLVYVLLNDEAAADDPARYKLMSYDYKSGDNRQLATTNYFNSVLSAGSKIYYAPASAYQNGINLGVFAVFADGSGKQPIIDQESWNIIRTAYDNLTIAVQQEWYGYKPGDAKATKIAGQPTDTTSRIYIDSPNGKQSVWIDSRDGKGVIVVYDIAKKTETVLLSQNGISGPIRWLNNSTIIFRSATGRETADYVISVDGGTAQKVTNVTNTAGINRWTY